MGLVDPIPMGIIEMVPRKTPVGILTANRENETTIVIKNTGDAPLIISRIISSKFKTVYFNAASEDEITITAGCQRVVKLIVKPTELGRFLDSILIHSDARNDIGKGYRGLLSGEVH